MQLYIGREFSKTEIVHHIDGNKHNNDIKNLELSDIKKHSRYHAQIKSFNTERVEIKCSQCDKFIILSKKYYNWKKKNGQNNFYCSRRCNGLNSNLQHSELDIDSINIIINEYINGKTGYAISKEYGFVYKTVYNHINRFKMLL